MKRMDEAGYNERLFSGGPPDEAAHGALSMGRVNDREDGLSPRRHR